MSKPKISIIVPVYNTEKYLHQCVESILSQSFKDFELLLIDDGSRDGSGVICDEYASNDKRVRVWHQENQGVSVARDVGLEHAQGEWIYFPDSDDIITEDAFETMVSMVYDGVDYVICGYEVYDENGNCTYAIAERKQRLIMRDKALIEMFTPTDYRYQGYLWNKLFNASIIRDNNLRFVKGIKFNEDRLFNVDYLCHIDGNVAYSTTPIYKYVERSNSAMASLAQRFNPFFITDLDAFVTMGQLLTNHRHPEELMDAHYTAMMLDSVLRMYYFCNRWGNLNLKWIYKIESRVIKGLSCKHYLLHMIAVFIFFMNKKDTYNNHRTRFIRYSSFYHNMTSMMEFKKVLKKIMSHIFPNAIKEYARKVNQMRKQNKSTWVTAIRKARIYEGNDAIEPCFDYTRQMKSLLMDMTIDTSMTYVYPYDVWKRRNPQTNRCSLFSMTVDYTIILQSSLLDLSHKLSSCSRDEFKSNELEIVGILRSLSRRIQMELSVKETRPAQLKSYFAHMLDNEPISFDEALQKILFYNGLFWQANHWHNGLGRLDLILEKYYNNDIQRGILTKSQAKEMLRDFVQILGKHTRQKSVVLIGDTGQYVLLGGVDKKGQTVQNDLTELFLEIFTELKVPDPKLILRVNEHTSNTIWQKAVDCVVTGCGSPLFMNEKLIMDGMVEFGYQKEDVWNVGTSACWEPLIIGKSFDQNNPFPNIPVVTALNDVIHSGTKYKTLDAIIDATKCNIATQIKEIIHDIPFDVSPLYSLFFDSCIERGKDYSQGGADYAYHGVQVVGLPNLVNALLNIKKYVFEQKILSLDQCRGALAANFVGYEDVREMLLSNEQKFGNSHPEVVAITNDLMSFISQEVEKYTCNGEKLKVGFSSSQYIMARMKSKASLDGRKDYDPFAVHISPVSQKVDIQEVLDFAGLLDYSGNRLNGNVVDFILPSAYIKQKDKLVTILRNAMTSGVYELQLNVLDAATLRDAKAHPEKYPDLVVRVWGFSAYFNDLPEEYKDNLIARAEAYE